MLTVSTKSLKELNHDYIEFNKNITGRKHYIQFPHGFIRGWNAVTSSKLYRWVHGVMPIADLVLVLSKSLEIIWDPTNPRYYNVLTLTEADVELHYHMVIDYFNSHTAAKHIVY